MPEVRCSAILLSLLTALLFTPSCTKKTPTLSLLVWEGYADPSFVKAFEEQHHCKVSASYMGSSDELVAKLRGGSAGNYDVISPSSDVATSIAVGGTGGSAGFDEDSGLWTTLSAAHFPAAGSGEGPGVWSSVHVGSGPAALRHHGFRAASGELERACGIRNTKERFRCGTICRRCTWQRKFWAMTSPIHRSFTT